MSFLRKIFAEDEGQDMVEYGMVIALVVLAATAILTGFNTNIGTAFTALGTDVTTQVH
jgi:pilus assembly protein Flp/PilA